LFSHFDPANTTPRGGYAYNTTYSPPAMGRFSAYAGAGRQSLRYTTPSSALSSGANALFTNDSYKYSAYLGFGLGLDKLGSISLGSTQQSSWAGVGTVGQGSRALVRVQTNKDRLKVVWGDKPEETCLVNYALDEKQKADASGFTNWKLKWEVAGVAEKTAQARE